MRLDDQRASSNIEDRRGMSVGRGVAGGGIGVIVLALVAMFFGVDPSIILQGGSALAPPAEQRAPAAPGGAPGDAAGQFVAKVLGSTEDVWTEVFAKSGRTYRKPTLVLFSGQVESACGFAQAAVGPFYCPPDQKVYIDLDFYRRPRPALRRPGRLRAGLRARARGRAPRAEPARHRRTRARACSSVRRARRPTRCPCAWSCRPTASPACGPRTRTPSAGCSSPATSRRASPRRPRSATTASRWPAAATSCRTRFTHGSAEQRVRWFRRGLESGDIRQCDTFAAASL